MPQVKKSLHFIIIQSNETVSVVKRQNSGKEKMLRFSTETILCTNILLFFLFFTNLCNSGPCLDNGDWFQCDDHCFILKTRVNKHEAMAICKDTLGVEVYNPPGDTCEEDVMTYFGNKKVWLDVTYNGTCFLWPNNSVVIDPDDNECLSSHRPRCVQYAPVNMRYNKRHCRNNGKVICKGKACPEGYDQHLNGICYQLFNEPDERINFTEAKAACEVSIQISNQNVKGDDIPLIILYAHFMQTRRKHDL